jgi:hypothetical protein
MVGMVIRSYYHVEVANGIHPTWSPDGKELFYAAGVSQFVAVVLN